MKEKTTEKKLFEYRYGIVESIARWKSICENGCNDPFWADGCNMNLERNHILYYKNEISKLCSQEEIEIPEEYYLPTPPEVNDNYMANLKKKKRVKRLKEHGDVLTTKSVDYDEAQISLF